MNNNPMFFDASHPSYAGAVRDIQRQLRRLAEQDSRIPSVPIDGVYASATRGAVEAFQRAYGLPVTGAVDPVTWETLRLAALAAKARYGLPRSISPFPIAPIGYEIAQGEESELVALLHHMLRTLGQNYDDLGEIPDGLLYTGRTAHAVSRVQGKHALPATGRVDRPTWNLLAEAYDRILGQKQ